MRRLLHRYLASALALFGPIAPAHAQELNEREEHQGAAPAAGLELWSSTDSDDTDVVKVLGRALWSFNGRDDFKGIAVERAFFAPQGQHTRKHERIYLDLADNFDGKWLWKARFGTDGDTILGSATLRASDWSKEFYVEREIVETPQGIDKGVYYTFAGASFDLPISERAVFNVMGGSRNSQATMSGSTSAAPTFT